MPGEFALLVQAVKILFWSLQKKEVMFVEGVLQDVFLQGFFKRMLSNLMVTNA